MLGVKPPLKNNRGSYKHRCLPTDYHHPMGSKLSPEAVLLTGARNPQGVHLPRGVLRPFILLTGARNPEGFHLPEVSIFA